LVPKKPGRNGGAVIFGQKVKLHETAKLPKHCWGDFLYHFIILCRADKKYIQVDPIDLSNPNTFTVDFNMMSFYFCSVWMLGNSPDRDTPIGP